MDRTTQTTTLRRSAVQFSKATVSFSNLDMTKSVHERQRSRWHVLNLEDWRALGEPDTITLTVSASR